MKTLLTSLSLIALLAATTVHAEDDEPIGASASGAGLGAGASSNTRDGNGYDTHARIFGRTLGDDDDGGPLHNIEGSLTYNVIGAKDGKLTTGIRGRLRAGAGGTLSGPQERGCDLYLMLSGGLDIEAGYNHNGANHASGGAGPETGLACKWKDGILMVSPSVRVGGSTNTGDYNTVGDNVRADVLQFGGVARIVAGKKFFLTAEGFYSPSMEDAGYREGKMHWSTTNVGLSADYRVSDKFIIQGEAHVNDYKGASAGAEDLRDTSVSVTAIRAF